jgi:predicted NBD/HSP70 family sugar kinase
MYAAVDIGGSKTLVVAFDDERNIIEQGKFPTPKSYEEFKSQLAQTAANFQTKSFTAGGVGIRGNIDRVKGLSLLDDVLPWGKAPVRDDCSEIFGCPFVLENDSKLAGLSEATLVADKYSKVLYLTISTGIGSAFVVDGKLDPDTINSEIGKGVYEHEGKIQQWEDFASGKAIVDKYGKRASELDDPEAWSEISRNLAMGLLDAIAAFTPDVVVLGGGVGSHFKKFEKPLIDALKQVKPPEINIPPVIQATHPEEAVIYGCFELAKDAYGKRS